MCHTVAPDPCWKAVMLPFSLILLLPCLLSIVNLESFLRCGSTSSTYLSNYSQPLMLPCFRMSFATSNAMAHLAALQKEREENKGDADYTLTCQGKVIKAHSFILKMRWLSLHRKLNLYFSFQFSILQERSHYQCWRKEE